MASTTSGTTQFNLDVDEIIEDALEPLGGEHSGGHDMVKARRTLNLLLIQLQNKNIPLNKIEEVDLTLQENIDTYTLDVSVVDVLELSLQTNNSDIFVPLTRDGVRDFHRIPNRETKNRPTRWATDRREDAVKVKFWAIPNQTYTAKLLVSKRVEDVNASYQKIELSYRYLPLVTKWLSYELALKKQGVPPELIMKLESEKMLAMNDAFEEDRERVDFIIRPGGISGK